MSVWTQVFGAVSGFSSRDEKGLKKAIGEMRTMDDFEKYRISAQKWRDSFDKSKNPIPMGSEGSVEYSLRYRGDEYSGDRAFLTFYGSLRDYDDTQYLLKWFAGIFNAVRGPSAYISFNDEWGERTVSYGVYPKLFRRGSLNTDRNAFVETVCGRDGQVSSRVVWISPETGEVTEVEADKLK